VTANCILLKKTASPYSGEPVLLELCRCYVRRTSVCYPYEGVAQAVPIAVGATAVTTATAPLSQPTVVVIHLPLNSYSYSGKKDYLTRTFLDLQFFPLSSTQTQGCDQHQVAY
jgi:hypothetical protein